MLLSLRDELEVRDFQQFFSLIFKGCVEECSHQGSKQETREHSRGKLRRGTEKDRYYSARKSSEIRQLASLFFAPISDIGDSLRFGSSLKVVIFLSIGYSSR